MLQRAVAIRLSGSPFYPAEGAFKIGVSRPLQASFMPMEIR